MHWPPDPSTSNPVDELDDDTPTSVTAQTFKSPMALAAQPAVHHPHIVTAQPSTAAQQFSDTTSESLQGTKRLRPLHLMPGPESREKVLLQSRWALEYLDLTSDGEDPPPKRMRPSVLQGNHDIRTSPPIALTSELTHPNKRSLPSSKIQSDLAGHVKSKKGSSVEVCSKIMTMKSPKVQRTSYPTTVNRQEIEQSISNGQQRFSRLPFLDKGYCSFSSSHKVRQDNLELSEEDLARKLIILDNLRASTKNEIMSPSPSDISNLGIQKRSTETEGERVEMLSDESGSTLNSTTGDRTESNREDNEYGLTICSHLPQTLPHHAPSSSFGPKFHSPYSEDIRNSAKAQAKARLRAIHEESVQRSLSSVSNSLQKSQNHTGGLAILAQQAELNHHERIEPNQTRGCLRLSTSPNTLRPAPRSTAVTADTFQTDLSKYKLMLSHEEAEIIRRHEWLKERQRDLRIVKETFVETARLYCITGQVTKAMDDELPKLYEYQKLVLEFGQSDKAKRRTVQNIKANMVRRQTCCVSDEDMALNLGIIVDRKVLQQIEQELMTLEDETEVLSHKRLEHNQKRSTKAKKQSTDTSKSVRLVSATADSLPSRPSGHIPDDTVTEIVDEIRPTRPKKGTEEHRQSRRAGFEEWNAQQEAILREKLRRFDERKAQSSSGQEACEETTIIQTATAKEHDTQSEVSEEDEGFEMYAGFDATSALEVPKSANTAKPSRASNLDEIEKLEEERRRKQQQEDSRARPDSPQEDLPHRTISAQAPDLALAREIQMHRLGIPRQDVIVDIEDAASDMSDESSSSSNSTRYVNNYLVWACYRGVPELEDSHDHHLGRFLHKANAESRVRDTIAQFCALRRRAIALATAAADEAELARLGDPDAGTGEYDLKTGQQTMAFPASSCRVWIERRVVAARRKSEHEISAPATVFWPLWRRTRADGTVVTPGWEEVRPANCAWLANRTAGRVIEEWFAAHMKERVDLTLRLDELWRKVGEMGEEGWFCEKETVQVDGGGEETMEVWVTGGKRLETRGN